MAENKIEVNIDDQRDPTAMGSQNPGEVPIPISSEAQNPKQNPSLNLNKPSQSVIDNSAITAADKKQSTDNNLGKLNHNDKYRTGTTTGSEQERGADGSGNHSNLAELV